jgi:hypothetical protein
MIGDAQQLGVSILDLVGCEPLLRYGCGPVPRSASTGSRVTSPSLCADLECRRAVPPARRPPPFVESRPGEVLAPVALGSPEPSAAAGPSMPR